MRPVERGQAPRIYKKYTDAISDLEQRLGTYCSYCERTVKSSLAVEHKYPKKKCRTLRLEWKNFLLACNTCNGIKGQRIMQEVIWPDLNNTLLAIEYSEGGFVAVASNLNNSQDIRAKSLIDLVGLSRHPGNVSDKPTRRDTRWMDREEIWQAAEGCKSNYAILGKSEEALSLVLIAAKHSGFFSVWIEVFKDEPEVLNALIAAFPGTAKNCFDVYGIPVPRAGTDI